MLIKLDTKKKSLSLGLLIFFAITLAISAAISEFFQAVGTNEDFDRTKYQSLFNPNAIKAIKKITLTNRLGTFQVEKSNINNFLTWNLISPRNLPAKGKTIANIILALKEMKVRKIFTRDDINLSNFSLNNPLITLNVIYNNDIKESLHLGAVNSFDNSTYALLSNQNGIYHIDAIKYPFESLDLPNFVDSNVFPISLENISKLVIYKGSIESNTIRLSFIRNQDGSWIDVNKRKLNPTKVETQIKKILSIQSQLILDHVEEETQLAINKYNERPYLTISITDINSATHQYNISRVVSRLPQIMIEKNQNVIVTSSKRSFPYILNKGNLDVFLKSKRYFRK